MRASPGLSAIVSTFDRPGALALALESLREASSGAPELEVVVADDGSGPATREAVEAFAGSAPFPVLHVREEHRGFRLARIRNRAVRAARGEVLVFLDGDCLLFPGALALHARRTRPGRAHTGSRVFLPAPETASLLSGARGAGELRGAALGRAHRGLRRLFLENLLHRSLRLKPRPKLVAANCAVHRADLERVNGFDERFVGWGFEDDDLARRLRRSGVRIADGTLDCLALHLFHAVHPSHRPTARGTPNEVYFRKRRFLTRCRRGLEREPLESLRYRVVGRPPSALRPLLESLEAVSPGRPAPRVTLVFSGTPAPVWPRGEPMVRVPEEVSAAGPEALRALLEEAL